MMRGVVWGSLTVLLLACSATGASNGPAAGGDAAPATGVGGVTNTGAADGSATGDAPATSSGGTGAATNGTGGTGAATTDSGSTVLTASGGASPTGGTGGAGNVATGGRGGAIGDAGIDGRAIGDAATDSASANSTGDASNSASGDIGTWADGPGTCPAGMPRIEISSVAELASASRGEDTHQNDPASVCYFLHNGTYTQSGTSPSMYVKVGGTDATHRRAFVGESRGGVILKGRATIESGASHVQISNLTFDLTGYSQSGSFNTLTLSENSSDLRIDHITFTGDCMTGANGGHVEIDGSTDVVVEDCLIEKFGRCGPNGHQDHGVYLGSGSNLVIRNNEIRGNASRGVQLNTEGGEYGTIDQVTIEKNRIHDNGHADYEDGIVMNATGTGTISHVTVQHNLIYGNYYSGLRESGDAFQSVVIQYNTFFHNGAASSASGRSELNLDDEGSGASTSITRNIIVAANRVLNDCFDAQPRGYAMTDNVVEGSLPSGTSGNCVSIQTSVDPAFANTADADFHPQNAAVNGYGAYAP